MHNLKNLDGHAVAKQLDDKYEQVAALIEIVQSQQRQFEAYQWVWVFKLRSMWSREGERDVEVIGGNNLLHLVDQASTKFRNINNRSNVQANFTVEIKFNDGPSHTVLTGIFNDDEFNKIYQEHIG